MQLVNFIYFGLKFFIVPFDFDCSRANTIFHLQIKEIYYKSYDNIIYIVIFIEVFYIKLGSKYCVLVGTCKMHVLFVTILCLLVHHSTSETSITVPLPSSSREISCLQDGVVACTSDCKSRLFCMLNQIRTIDCLPQTGRPYCNAETLECVYTPGNCSSKEESEFICPGVGKYPHATDCTKFWLCSDTKAVAVQCSNNMRYDPKNRVCSNNVQCFNFSPIIGWCKGQEGSVIVHPLMKSIYFHCAGHFPQLNECPENLIFNTNTLKCEVECLIEGVLKDPTSTQCYYNCLRTSAGLKPERVCCPENSSFDEIVLACIPN